MKLRARFYIIPAIVAAIASVTAVGCSGASAAPAEHTLTFTSMQQQMAQFSSTNSGFQEKVINKAGKTIGYDIQSFSFDPKTKASSVQVALLVNGGFLYGVMPTTGRVFHGHVTGGTGIFQGATGTITAASVSPTSPYSHVTIVYHT